MSKEFTHSSTLEAPPERVVELMTDEKSVTERYEAARFSGVSVSSRTDGDTIVVQSERDEKGQLPGPLARLTGGSVHLRQTDTWAAPSPDGARRATWTVGASGVPVTIEGTIEVRPSGTGAVLTHRATVKARVPLIGGRIEALTIDQTVAKIETEGRWLAAHV